MASLILASSSQRRVELLSQIGLVFDTASPDIDETLLSQETVEQYVERLAIEKAQCVLQMMPTQTIIAADTCLCVDGKIIGKPTSKVHAFEIWSLLSDRYHDVFSGVCVINKDHIKSCVVKTQVKFNQLSLNDMENYWATGEPVGKAGAYAIQGIGACYIPQIIGSYTNVVGLPLHETVTLLKAIKALN